MSLRLYPKGSTLAAPAFSSLLLVWGCSGSLCFPTGAFCSRKDIPCAPSLSSEHHLEAGQPLSSWLPLVLCLAWAVAVVEPIVFPKC